MTCIAAWQWRRKSSWPVKSSTWVSALCASRTQADFLKITRTGEASNIHALLPSLQVPVLLLYKGIPFRRTFEWAKTMAGAIRNAQLVLLDDDGDLYGYRATLANCWLPSMASYSRSTPSISTRPTTRTLASMDSVPDTL
jgi:hypothetical protein